MKESIIHIHRTRIVIVDTQGMITTDKGGVFGPFTRWVWESRGEKNVQESMINV